jgi:hypothetical protein
MSFLWVEMIPAIGYWRLAVGVWLLAVGQLLIAKR